MSVVTFSERLKMELGNRKPSEVTDLFMDNCKADEIEGLDGDFSSLKCLSLVNVGLNSLKNLPVLSSLTKIDASENRISGDLEPLSKCLKLRSINLTSNKIRSIDVLKPLVELPNLTSLDLKDNEIEEYKEKVIALFPKLQVLDGQSLNTEAVASDDEDDEEEILDDEDDDDDDEDFEDEEEEESYGLQALQNSEDLEDDENDYNPGENDDEDDDDLDSEFDDEEEAEISKDDVASRKRKATEDGDKNADLPSKMSNGNDH